MSDLPELLMVVFAKIDPDFENAWNEWYDSKHLPEIVACPGFEAAARYVSDQHGAREYITVYEMNDPHAMEGEEFNNRRGWEEFAPHVEGRVRKFKKVRHHEKR